MVYDDDNRAVIGVMLGVMLIFYYGYIWGQIYNVYATRDYKNVKYTNRMLWINTNLLDVTNIEHRNWANYVLIDCAPNKLGIYIEEEQVSKLFVLKQLETFKIMFGYNCPIIYFKYRQNQIIRNFCGMKGVKVINYSLRHNI
jgi:hypothetical protein